MLLAGEGAVTTYDEADVQQQRQDAVEYLEGIKARGWLGRCSAAAGKVLHDARVDRFSRGRLTNSTTHPLG
jgi:hypothetical protein